MSSQTLGLRLPKTLSFQWAGLLVPEPQEYVKYGLFGYYYGFGAIILPTFGVQVVVSEDPNTFASETLNFERRRSIARCSLNSNALYLNHRA